MDWTTVVSSVFASGVVAGLVSHYSSKWLGVHAMNMEVKRELYTNICNQLAFFTTLVKEEESDNARGDLLKYFREAQLWGSDEVARSFRKLITLMLPENSGLENERNLQYKKLIIAMRKDLRKTRMAPEEIDIRGFRN